MKHKNKEWRLNKWIKNNSKKFYLLLLLKFSRILMNKAKKIETELKTEGIKMRVNTPEGTRKALDNCISRLMKLGRQDEAKTIHDIKDKMYPQPKDEGSINNEPEPEKNV